MSITAEEVAEVFRQALRGEIEVKIHGDQSWNSVYCGDVEFQFGDWHIVIFNDCNEFDYVSIALSPDNQECEFDDWWPHNPVDILSEEEIARMEALVENLAV